MGPCINDFRVAALTERLTKKKGSIFYASPESRQSIMKERTWQWACESCLAAGSRRNGKSDQAMGHQRLSKTPASFYNNVLHSKGFTSLK